MAVIRLIYSCLGICFLYMGFYGSKHTSEHSVILGKYSTIYFMVLVFIFLLGLVFLCMAMIKKIHSQKKVHFTFFTLVIVFILMEGILNLSVRLFASNEIKQKLISYKNSIGVQYKYIPHHYTLYDLNPNYKTDVNRHNSFGLRGDEINLSKKIGIFRIICIGGSTTYTEFVQNYKKSFPFLLNKILHDKGYINVEVLNGGVGGVYNIRIFNKIYY